jgi:hypothetical protein
MSPCFAGMAGSLAAGTSKQRIICTPDMVAARATVNRPDSRSAREFREEYTNKHFTETTFGRKTR